VTKYWENSEMKKGKTKLLYVGIDVHSREHKVAIAPSSLLERSMSWKSAKFLNIRNNARDFARLEKAIKSKTANPNDVTCIVDATGHYSEPLVYFLQNKGYGICHLESRAVKQVREGILDQENKSDEVDSVAFTLLRYLKDTYGLSFRISDRIPDLYSEASILNTMMILRDKYAKLKTQATNRLRNFLLIVFPEGEAKYARDLLKISHIYPTPADILNNSDFKNERKIPGKHKTDILKLAQNTVGVPGDKYRWLIRDLSLQRNEYTIKMKDIMERIRENLHNHPYNKITTSFPGIGDVGSATLIGVIKDITRFPNKNRLRKMFGVYARLSQSGFGKPDTKAGKEGNHRAKRILFLACFMCITHKAKDNDFRDYYERLVERGMLKISALSATMGKMAEIMYHCLMNNEPYHYTGIYQRRIKQQAPNDNPG
jgi:transposase